MFELEVSWMVTSSLFGYFLLFTWTVKPFYLGFQLGLMTGVGKDMRQYLLEMRQCLLPCTFPFTLLGKFSLKNVDC
jgi:hypothetical protein